MNAITKLDAEFGTNYPKAQNETINHNTAQQKSKGYPILMRISLVLFLLAAATFKVAAQKALVTAAFAKHNIDINILNAENLEQPTDYAFELKQVTTTAGKQNSIIARFDPSSPKEEQWTVLSVDGKMPSKSDVSSFRKNQDKQTAANKIDEASYKVETESADYLVISYKQDPASLAKDAAFMKDCRLFMTINLKTKKMEKVQALNEKPLKIKILNAEKFDLISKYNRDEQNKRYLIQHQDLNILAKFMGQAVDVQTISTYSNYVKK